MPNSSGQSLSEVGIVRFEMFPIECRPEKPATKTQKAKRLVPDYLSVLGEMQRIKGDEPHIVGTRKAQLLFGRPPSAIASDIRQQLETERLRLGRAVNSQTNVLLAGFASFPSSNDELNANPALFGPFKTWCALVPAFLKAEFGDRLDTLVLHLDESQPHIHFACGIRFSKEERSVSCVHPGVKVRPDDIAGRAKSGREWKGQRFNFAKGTRDFLDRYFRQVSAPLGHARFGAGTGSLNRKEWQQQRAQREALKHALEEAQRVRREIDRALREFEQERLAKMKILDALEQKVERSRSKLVRIQERTRELARLRGRLRMALKWATTHGIDVPRPVREAAGLSDAGSAQP